MCTCSCSDEGNPDLGSQDDPFQMPACDVFLEEPEVEDYTYTMPVNTADMVTNTTKTLPVSILQPMSPAPVQLRPTVSFQQLSQQLAKPSTPGPGGARIKLVN